MVVLQGEAVWFAVGGRCRNACTWRSEDVAIQRQRRQQGELDEVTAFHACRMQLPPLPVVGEGWGGVKPSRGEFMLCGKRIQPHPSPPLGAGEGARHRGWGMPRIIKSC